VSAVPTDTSRATVRSEEPALRAVAERHDWAISLDVEGLRLTATTNHPVADVGGLRLDADLNDYRALPPAWRFVDPETGEVTKRAFPKAGTGPQGSGSIFHSNPVICAPFNRLAYKDNGGPHSDWSGPANWLNVTGHVVAHTLGEMLSVIDLHLRVSPGRMA
jgi:hypothetical protein